MKKYLYPAAYAGIMSMSAFLGGWNTALKALAVCAALDYVLGMLAAAVFRKSKHTRHGALESRAGWKGLIRKGAEFSVVIVGNQIDILTGTSYVRDAVCIGFIINEALSILENVGLMGVPIPEVIKKSIDILTDENGTLKEGKKTVKPNEPNDTESKNGYSEISNDGEENQNQSADH